MANKEMMFLSGNEAFARGAWEAGVRVGCAYPGTPSTEIMENLARYPEVDTQWSVNEKVSLEVALGAAYGGVRALCTCKHVGLNVAMDPLMTGVYTGINAGLVLIVADDPGMHSSQNEQDTRWVGPYAKIPILEPSDPREAWAFVQEAFELSERFDTPVIVRTTTRISHSKENFEVGQRQEREPKPFAIDWQKYVMVPGNARRRHALVEARMNDIRSFAAGSSFNRIEMNDTSLGIITDSVSYHYVREALPSASILKLGMVWPLCFDTVSSFLSRVDTAVVVEELDPFIETMLRSRGLSVAGKHESFVLDELRPEFISTVVEGKPRNVEQRAMRPPQLCKGCPHRLAFKALGELGAIVSGDIGCYTLGALAPFSALHTCVCMGASVTVHEGLRLARFADSTKVVGVIGDSTFVHSGITGLINAAYNRAKGLIIILDNSTTAMTGGQTHPGTGKDIHGQPTKQLVIEDICRSCGADNVDVILPQKYNDMKALFEKRLNEEALSVIICRSPCLLIR